MDRQRLVLLMGLLWAITAASGPVWAGWMGMAVVPPVGATVEELAPGGPAAQAGLQVGDQILAINGLEMRNVAQLTGMIANLADLDTFVEDQIIEPFDHRYLNEEVAAFREMVPTTENLCIEIFRRLKTFPKAKLERVRIQETANNSFEYAGTNLVEPEGNRP
jgi:hypothetical protein